MKNASFKRKKDKYSALISQGNKSRDRGEAPETQEGKGKERNVDSMGYSPFGKQSLTHENRWKLRDNIRGEISTTRGLLPSVLLRVA